jgi:hypothetical protein
LNFDKYYLNPNVKSNLKKYWEDCPDWLQYEILMNAKFIEFIFFLENSKLFTKGKSKSEFFKGIENAKNNNQMYYPGTLSKIAPNNKWSNWETIGGNLKRISPLWLGRPTHPDRTKKELLKYLNNYIELNFSVVEYLILIMATLKRSITSLMDLDGVSIEATRVKQRTDWIAGMYNHSHPVNINTDRKSSSFKSQNWGGIKTGGCSMSIKWIHLWEYLALVSINDWEFRVPKDAKLNVIMAKKEGAITTTPKLSIEQIMRWEPGWYRCNSKPTTGAVNIMSWITHIFPTTLPNGANSRYLCEHDTVKLLPDSEISLYNHPDAKDYISMPAKIHIPLFFISEFGTDFKYINWLDNPLHKEFTKIKNDKLILERKKSNKIIHDYQMKLTNAEYFSEYRKNMEEGRVTAEAKLIHELKTRDIDANGIYLNRVLLHEIHEYMVRYLQNNLEGTDLLDKHLPLDIIEVIQSIMLYPSTDKVTIASPLYKAFKSFLNDYPFFKPLMLKTRVGNPRYYHFLKTVYNYTGDLTPYLPASSAQRLENREKIHIYNWPVNAGNKGGWFYGADIAKTYTVAFPPILFTHYVDVYSDLN